MGESFWISRRKKELFVKIGTNFSCVWWGDNWGDISDFIEKSIHAQPISKIKVIFSDCVWADPIPLLSITLYLQHIKYDYRLPIEVILPRLDSTNEGNQNFQKGQFLKFLATQGFLDIFVNNFIVRDYKYAVDLRTIEKYQNYQYKLFYNEAEVFRARLFTIENDDSKQKIIKIVEDEMYGTLKSTVSLQTFNTVLEQIYNVLNELIENVRQHAYHDGETKRFGLYIRKRYGGTKNYGLDTEGAQSIIDKKERINCPALDNQVLLESDSILEIFFVDIGMGLKGSLHDHFTKLSKNYKYPIRELFCKVLRDGMRKDTKFSLTAFGGLHFLCRVLLESNGYIWCNEGVEWVGASCVNLLKETTEVKAALTGTYSNNFHPGLAWGIRIPFNDSKRRTNSISVNWNGQSNEHPVFRAYQNQEREVSTFRTLVFDDRKDATILMQGSAENWICSYTDDMLNMDLSKVDTFVWFPKSFYSKNHIIKMAKDHTKKILNTAIEKEINFVIGEITAHELISFFYAFNCLDCIRLGTEKIKKIVLITKNWDVVYLENNNGKLLNSTDNAINYYSGQIKNSTMIHESLTLYAYALRAYDSFFFWKTIYQYKADRLFINAKINWSESKQISGYLDFERIYLYGDLYDLLKNALLRMAGCIRNSNVEFLSIDYSAARICQDANIESMPYKDNSVFSIHVGTVCASGYTRDAYYKDAHVDFNVNLFAHPSFDKKISNTAFLLIWPEGNFNDFFPSETKNYYRLGKTGLISERRHERLISTSTAYANTIRSKVETYIDFQQRYPKFIKYGHYHTDSHHYLIGFDMITYMKYSYLKREGAFVYVLCKIISYLSDGKPEAETISELRDQKWGDIVSRCKYESKDKGELIVYHSNTFTEYFMKYVRDILPVCLSERIIPLNIVEIQSKGAPIAFSPFIYEKLKSVFEKGEKKGILYIDSNFSTGRHMLEIENILLSTGCHEVHFFALFDMRRLRNADQRATAYWKINLPRLNDDSTCLICDALKKAEAFKDEVEGSSVARIKTWQTNWSCMSVLNTREGHGIDGENMTVSYKEDNIHIVDPNVLNLYMAERISETYSNDSIYHFLRKKTDLSIYLKIQLICTQICLYGNQISRKLQLTLLCELIGNMAKQDIVNSYTSLGSLVLITQNESVIYELLHEILYLNQTPTVLSIKKYLLNSTNKDLVIAIAFFVKKYAFIEQLVNGYEEQKSIFIKKLNEVLLPDKDLKLLSKEFEGILVNELGRARHSTNIQKLLMDHASSYETYIQQCDSALHDLHRLCDIAQKLPVALANSNLKSNALFTNVRSSIIQIEHLTALDKERIRNRDNAFASDQIMAGDELKREIKVCEKYFFEILNSYFISYSATAEEYFNVLVKNFEEKYNKKIELSIYGEKNSKWYYWNQGIEKEFRYFIDNIEHCEKNIHDEIKMKIDIRFDYNQLLIELISWSEKTDVLVKQAFLHKNRLSKEQCLAFDVMFDFVNERKEDDYFLLKTRMSIPACYQQLGGL